MEYQATGQLPGKLGSASPLFAPYQAFRAKDGYISVIGTGGKDHWERFCKALGHMEWETDPRFIDNPNRIKNLAELTFLIEDVLTRATVDEWIQCFTALGLACDPIQSLDQMMEDPQVVARDMIVEKMHPIAGLLKFTGIPIKLSDTPGNIEHLPPEVGEHTEEILKDLGYSNIQITEFRKNHII
jgi:CoA:oxalate CoA-transferase